MILIYSLNAKAAFRLLFFSFSRNNDIFSYYDENDDKRKNYILLFFKLASEYIEINLFDVG